MEILSHEEKMLLMAEQQFTGYAIAISSGMTELVESMGLTKDEWEQLKSEGRVAMLTERMIEEVDDILNR